MEINHVCEEVRKQSALLIIRKIQEIVGELPAMMMGDLNATDEVCNQKGH